MKVRELSYFRPKHSGFTTLTWSSNLAGEFTESAFKKLVPSYVHVDKVWVPGVTYMPKTTGKFGIQMFESTHRKRPVFNDCDNVKVRAVASPVTCFFQAKLPTQYYGWWRYCPSLTKNSVNAAEPLAGHPRLNLHNAQVTAWLTMQPRFEGDISLFNFVWELKDMKSLLIALRGKPLKKLANFFRKNRGKAPATKPLAQTHLSVEFALKPLISDILTIGCQIEDIVAEAQQKFADSGRELSTRHYSETFVHSTVDLRSSTIRKLSPNDPEGYCYETKFTASMEYSYKYNMRSPLQAMIKYWGAGSTREALWNGLPFSFVADYFINLGDCIRLTDLDENVGLNLSQYCESLWTRKCTGKFINAAKTWDGLYGRCAENCPTSLGTQVAGIESSYYTRRKCVPNYGMLIPRIKLPSGKQALNCLALLRAFF